MEVVAETRKVSVVSIQRGFTNDTSVPPRDGVGGSGSVAAGVGSGGGCSGGSVGAAVVCRPPNGTNALVSKMLSPPNGGGRNGFTVARERDGCAVAGGGGMKILSNGTAAAVVNNNNNNNIIINNNNNIVLMKPPSSAPSMAKAERKNNNINIGGGNNKRGLTTEVIPAAPRNPPTPAPPQVKLTTINNNNNTSTTSPTPTSPPPDLTTTPPSPSISSPHNPPPTDMDNKDNNDVDDDDAAVSNEDNNAGDDDGNNNVGGRESTTEATGSVSTTSTTTTTTGTETVGGGPIRNLRVRGQRKFLPEKTRHKRQTLQDMTRPLKQWLLRHRDNPYPSKAEKMDLVSKSQMTLTQVSNWFANARRRLKNTVKQPDLTWASRIKLYNSCVEGNAELFSICSDDSCPESDDDMMEHRQSDTFHDDVTDSLTSSRTATPDVTTGSGNFNNGSNNGSHSHSSNTSNNSHHHHPSYHHPHSSNSNSSSSSVPSTGPSAPHYPGLEDSCVSFHKYKHSILHRYLSDAHQQALILDEDSVAKSRDRHHSSSTGSRDFEELSTSSVSSPAHESVHHDHLDDFSEEFETMALRRRTSDLSSTAEEEDMYWKEIGAALALTSLARGRIVNT